MTTRPLLIIIFIFLMRYLARFEESLRGTKWERED